ncbi:aldehyde dehydrogenase family protein [Microbacterium sp. NPDC096154]|uniref:aldehyde dehydrogenase family protein n=1 Tax=Microbacterium sp. NPDC096154 TaxID=3155549 RepID=UPI0033164FBC
MTPAPARTIPVRNPRTGVEDFEIAVATADQVEEKAARLRANQRAWLERGLEGRTAVMQRWFEQFARVAKEFGEIEAVDTGGTHTSYVQGFITLEAIRGWIEDAADAIAAATITGPSKTMPTVDVQTQLVPYPLVGVISPWNAPTMLAMIDSIPALFAGSAVLWKPSEVTPRFVSAFFETVQAVPELAAVFDYVLGDGETGQAIVAQSDMVCFTGSVPTGRKIAVACAERLIPCFLELGGKDPVIVTETADIDRATTSVLHGGVYATGMVCFSIERVYVHESIHDEFVRELVRKAELVHLNDDNPKAGHVGPFTFAPQADIVAAHIEDARTKGASVLTGGVVENRGGGLYMRPTVLTGVHHGMDIMREETFGPCLPVMPYRDIDEAIALANDTTFGLTASVIAGTEDEALEIGRRIDAGTIFIQDTFLMPGKGRTIGTNAFGFSGLGGNRTGKDGILRFFRRKALLVQHGEPADIMNERFEER